MKIHAGLTVGTAREDRTTAVWVEHIITGRTTPGGREGIEHIVSAVDRLAPLTPLDEVRDWLIEAVELVEHIRPCLFVNQVGAGSTLLRMLDDERRAGRWPKGVHRPHAYEVVASLQPVPGKQTLQDLLDKVIAAYHAGTLRFADGLGEMDDIVRELVEFRPVVRDDGRIDYRGSALENVDDVLTALGLAFRAPRHGAGAASAPRFRGQSGRLWDHRGLVSGTDRAYV